MKKLLIIFSIFGVSVAIGLLLFNNIKINQTSPTVLNSIQADKKNLDSSPIKKLNIRKSKTVERNYLSLEDYYKDLNNFINNDVDKKNELCRSKFKQISRDKNFLDKDSDFFKTQEGTEKLMDFFTEIGRISNEGDIADGTIEKIMLSDDWDPLEIKTKMSQSVICQDVNYTNLTHSMIRSLNNKNLKADDRDSMLFMTVFMASAFSGNRRPIEYKFFAMEVLFGLLDNNLIPSKYGEELVSLRQRIIQNVQNFESDFSEKNDKRTNQELLRSYMEYSEDVHTQINEITENIISEMPRS